MMDRDVEFCIKHRMGFPDGEECPKCSEIAECDKLRAEAAKWKDEYENVCKFATDYEEQRDRLRAEIADYREALELISKDEWECISQSTGMRQSGPSDVADIARAALAKHGERK